MVGERESGRKRGREPTLTAEEIEASASTILKKGRDNMKRTPQATLTQSRLTSSGMLKIQTGPTTAPGQQHQTSELQPSVAALKTGICPRSKAPSRAVLSPGYMKARRAIRMWPVLGANEEQIWGNVGDFLHGTLRVPTSDVNQDDIEDIRRVDDGRSDVVHDEVIVTFRA